MGQQRLPVGGVRGVPPGSDEHMPPHGDGLGIRPVGQGCCFRVGVDGDVVHGRAQRGLQPGAQGCGDADGAVRCPLLEPRQQRPQRVGIDPLGQAPAAGGENGGDGAVAGRRMQVQDADVLRGVMRGPGGGHLPGARGRGLPHGCAIAHGADPFPRLTVAESVPQAAAPGVLRSRTRLPRWRRAARRRRRRLRRDLGHEVAHREGRRHRGRAAPGRRGRGPVGHRLVVGRDAAGPAGRRLAHPREDGGRPGRRADADRRAPSSSPSTNSP